MASKLTKKKAIQISKELWAWLAETGNEKEDWPGWEEYGRMQDDCPLCEYVSDKNHCSSCPLGVDVDCYGRGFWDWEMAETETDKKKYAKLFLEQLQELQ